MRTLAFTTATTHDPRSPAGRRWLPLALAGAYLALWAGTAVSPVDRGSWIIETALPVSLVAMLAGMYRRWHLSDAAYLCVALFLALHTVGAHYSYAHVPLGEWLQARAGDGDLAARNPYDRVVHFAFGLLFVYPTREALLYHVPSRRTGLLFAVAAVLGASAVYEVLEWGVARLVAPETAAGFVGTQGDPWDAQQDMALAWLGSMVAAALIPWLSRLRHGAPAAALPQRSQAATRTP